MIETVPMNSEQKRYLAEVRTLWLTVEPVMRRKAALVGGMHWKTVAGKEYLYRYQPDPVTKKKRSTSIGPRSPETETLYVDFFTSRERMRVELAELLPQLETSARMAKALRLNRLPEAVADVLTALNEDHLLELAPLAGRHAMRVFEVHRSQSYHVEEDWPGEVQFLVPDEMDLLRAMTTSLLRVDPYYQIEEDNVLRGLDGPVIRLTMQSDLVEQARNVLHDEHFELFVSLMELGPVVGVVPSKSGRPTPIAAVDPSLWAAMYAMSEGKEYAAKVIAGREDDDEVDWRLEEMIALLADGAHDRGPRI